MLAEAFAWLTTPASGTARRMGHLAESVAIAARHRRCRTAWAPHLAASRQALLASAQAAPGRGVALVLGSGHLFDVPLAELARLFDQVWLVDIVQPWSARLAARRHANVRLIEADVTACLDRPRPAPPVPALFLDRPEVAWVASVNLLSQLARLPRRWLRARQPEWTEAEAADFGETLMAKHLAWLGRFHAPACLLADLQHTVLDAAGAVVETRDFRPLLAGWEVDAQWRWDLAPPGELAAGRSAYNVVAALSQGRQQEHQDDIGNP